MHTRDYSEETSRVIDEEVERILRDQEERATQELLRHRKGLDAVAAALLEKETIDGAEVGRLVDTAYGRPVHGDGEKAVPHFAPSDETTVAESTADGTVAESTVAESTADDTVADGNGAPSASPTDVTQELPR